MSWSWTQSFEFCVVLSTAFPGSYFYRFGFCTWILCVSAMIRCLVISCFIFGKLCLVHLLFHILPWSYVLWLVSAVFPPCFLLPHYLSLPYLMSPLVLCPVVSNKVAVLSLGSLVVVGIWFPFSGMWVTFVNCPINTHPYIFLQVLLSAFGSASNHHTLHRKTWRSHKVIITLQFVKYWQSMEVKIHLSKPYQHHFVEDQLLNQVWQTTSWM